MTAGVTNSLVDVAGLRVGHAQRVGGGYRTGTTVVLAPPGGMVAGVDVRGAAPGTRETELLDPRNLVERVHAIVLTGGSAYGLSAACGVMERLADAGIGFPVEGGVVPIVPAAVIYDLGRGGVFRAVPDGALGAEAYDAAARSHGPDLRVSASAGSDPWGTGSDGPDLRANGSDGPDPWASGSVGAGTGAVAGGLAGGIGTASVVLPSGVTVAAMAVVNAVGSVLDPVGGRLSGTRYGLPGEFDHLREPREDEVAAWQGATVTSFNTTIGVVATDLTLTKAQCGKLAGVAHDGLARAIRPAHTMVDGDTIFGLSTCALPFPGAAAPGSPEPGATAFERAARSTPAEGAARRTSAEGAAGDTPAPVGAGRNAPGAAGLHDVLAAGADVFSRAVAHAMLAATGRDGAPAYRDVFPSAWGK
ncbi:P1 family peptidase [Nonomuraea sp. NEAU-A123]|uniref:P1 family peptidase n=1 Tax=Nonomuraea sp. NEAU-A123 TaxID=2839649 RepID=UPI0027DFE90F|nr:P1 family peptidase [Nonomuraea sp. NEAU-A123]